MKYMYILLLLIPIFSFSQINQLEFDKAIKLNNSNNITAATANLLLLKTKYPKDAKVFFIAGMLDYVKSDFSQSVINLTKSIELDAKFTKAYVARSTAYAAQEMYEKAIEDQNKAIIFEPKNLDFLSNRAYFFSENKQFAESLIDIKAKIKLEPNNITNYLEAVIVSKKIDNTFNADVYFEQALLVKTINKNKIQKLYGDYLLDNARFFEAEINYKKALADNEKSFTANDYHNLAITSEKIQNYEDAIIFYKKSIEKNPKNILVYNNLSSVYVDMKKWKELIDISESALAVNVSDPMTNMYMSIGLKYSGNKELAAEYEEKSRK